jgi:hypothetical protein
VSVLRVLVVLVASMLALAAAPASARSPDRKKPAPRRILRLEEMKVEGRIQKPQAMFLMPRANLAYGELDRPEPLLPKIERAVDKSPF